MLSRRYLRIKVMQALYGFFQLDNRDLAKGEKELISSVDRVYELYHLLLLLLVELRFNAIRAIEEAKQKHLPSREDLEPNLRFVSNKAIEKLDQNKQIQRFRQSGKYNWDNEGELTRKILSNIKAGPEYQAYQASEDHTFKTDRDFVIEIYRNYIGDYELLEHYLEEKNIFWYNDMDYVNAMVIRTLEGMNETDSDATPLLPLYKNEEEDVEFVKELFRKTVLNDEENQKYIAEKTRNWEVDRIALMDVLLMKMAITEILHFQTIPVKVTLNEYIEISKMFSTPKSKVFINGILDKLVIDFRSGNKLQKVGRGLIE